jgi:NAD(P)-dependent dehydrogenase (short-subunit alcohol dehydrogenase family)
MLARVADPDEIAAAVLFLSTGQSSFVTGSELFADGGEV